jgi:hypothetical protein
MERDYITTNMQMKNKNHK